MKPYPPEHMTLAGRIAPAAGALVVAALVALAATDMLSAGPARAADPVRELESLERTIGKTKEKQSNLERKASAASEDVRKLRRRSVAVAARAQRHEEAVAALEERMEALIGTEFEKARWLAERRTHLVKMLAALQRLARHPPIALIALPVPPSDTVRSIMLLRAAVPELEAQAKALSGDLDALARVRRQIDRAQKELESESAKLGGERRRLATLLVAKTRLAAHSRARSRAAAKRANRLGAEARDLRELLVRLQEDRYHELLRRKERGREQRRVRLIPPPQLSPQMPVEPPIVETTVPVVREIPPKQAPKIPAPTPRAPKAPALAMVAPRPQPAPQSAPQSATGGRFGLPARGRILRLFGQTDKLGRISRGITVATLQAAQVVAPRAGEVVFSGPFRGLGRLLIIELNRQYHVLLAGLARIDAVVGDRVLAGEPVGVMASDEAGKPALYVEIRRNGRPINPLPWLAAGRTRVKG